MNKLDNQIQADRVSELYQDLEERLMENIIRHIQNYDQPIASDIWFLQKLAEIGKLNEENMQIIAQSAGLSRTTVERLLQEAVEKSITRLEPGMQQLVKLGLIDEAIDPEESERLKKVMKTFYKQAKDTLNLCNTTMLYKARDAFKVLVGNIVSQAEETAKRQSFLDTLNTNATSAVIGAESRQQVIVKCIQEFNGKGIPAFVDKKGREWTPEAYVNMAMRNTIKNVADEAQNERIQEYGLDFIEIDSHSGARPKCAKDQGKIYSLSGKSGYITDARGEKVRYYSWKESSYGEPDGILGINCGHHKWPFYPGMSIQRYFPTEDTKANDKLYKQIQTQRALERAVRKEKRLCMELEKIKNKEAFEKHAIKLKQKEAQLAEYVDKHKDLYRRKDREQVVGFDKSISSTAVAINKKNIKEEKAQQFQQSELGIFKERLKQNKNIDKKYYSELKSKFSHGSNAAKKVFNKYVDFNAISNGAYIDVPHYNPNTKKISMNFANDIINERGSGVTWFHEHGHLIDDLSGRVSDDKEFLNLLQKDAFSYRINYGKENNLKTFSKVDIAISKDLCDMRRHSAISDIFQGVTMGEIRGVAGHSASYWNDKSITSEAFAHMFEAQFDNIRREEMKKYFPNALDYFEKNMERMSK